MKAAWGFFPHNKYNIPNKPSCIWFYDYLNLGCPGFVYNSYSVPMDTYSTIYACSVIVQVNTYLNKLPIIFSERGFQIIIRLHLKYRVVILSWGSSYSMRFFFILREGLYIMASLCGWRFGMIYWCNAERLLIGTMLLHHENKCTWSLNP